MRALLCLLPVIWGACDLTVVLGKSQGQGHGPDDLASRGDAGDGPVRALRFARGETIATGSLPGAVAIGDFSRDGRPDIAVASASEMRLSLLIQEPGGTFRAGPPLPAGGTAMAAADLSGDRLADLIVGSRDGDLRVYLQDAGGFTERTRLPVCGPAPPAALLLADLSGEGLLDVAVACAEANEVAVLLGQGSGRLGAPARYGVGRGPRALAAADLEGAGRSDLLVANRQSGDFSLLAGQGGGAFAMAVTRPLAPEVTGLVLVDLTQDRHPDLAATSFGRNELVVAPWIGGFFPEKSVNRYPIGVGPVALLSADLDADGRPDLVSANASGSVTVLLALADGRLGDPQHFGAGEQPGALAAGDLDGDGLPDLVVAQRDGVAILRNDSR
jgi:hypothetical protein